LSKWFQTRRSLWEFHLGAYVKLSWAVAAILVGGLNSEMADTIFEGDYPRGPIATKLSWNGPWKALFQNCVPWSRLPTKMATKLKIEKRGWNLKEIFSETTKPISTKLYLGRRAEPPDTFLEENHPMTISSKFSSYWANGFRQEDLYGNFT
jgi:hypothetical protein